MCIDSRGTFLEFLFCSPEMMVQTWHKRSWCGFELVFQKFFSLKLFNHFLLSDRCLIENLLSVQWLQWNTSMRFCDNFRYDVLNTATFANEMISLRWGSFSKFLITISNNATASFTSALPFKLLAWIVPSMVELTGCCNQCFIGKNECRMYSKF